VLEGSSQSDVTVEHVGSLSREPNRSKTVHVVGPCQKLFQQSGKLGGTTPVVYFASVFDRDLKLRGWSTNTDKDEMEEVVDEEEPVEGEGEGEGEEEGEGEGEGEGDVEGDEEEEGEEEEEWIEEEVEEEPDTVRDLLSTHSVWLRM
jgi:hypothetical protein